MDSLSRAFSLYTEKPLHFIYPLIIFFVFFFSFLFLIFGFYVVLSGIISNTSFTYYSLFLFLFIACLIKISFKGSVYRGFYIATMGKKQSLSNFFKSAYLFLPSFFLIKLIKLFIMLFFAIPVIAIYLFSPSVFDSLALKIVFALIYLFLYWIITYFFRVVEISITMKKLGFMKALKEIFPALKISLKKFFSLFPIYFIESIIVFFSLIPVINFFTIPVLYPIVMSSWFFELSPNTKKQYKKK